MPRGKHPPLRSGQSVGLLTLICLDLDRAPDANGRYWWRCVCQCGRYKTMRADTLEQKRVGSCGCKRGRPKQEG